MTGTLTKTFQSVLDGDQNGVRESVKAALNENISPSEILNASLVPAMTQVGELFEAREYYVPEMLIAARAMNAGLELIRPLLVQSGTKMAGKVALGTVKGDLHDIGKNLVGMMLEGTGFIVVDLGVDVSPDQFVNAIKEESVDIVAMSALLTTTMTSIPPVISAIEEAGFRDKVKIMIGGAPVTEDFAREVGADGFAADASRAARLAKTLLCERVKIS